MNLLRSLLPVVLAVCLCSIAGAAGYRVVVSEKTMDDPAWREVVDTLARKHGGDAVRYSETLEEVLPGLKERFPRYVCFVARPEEATREFVAQVHRLTRALDDDPYTDVIWGILTGYDAANALTFARASEPLEIRRVASGTDVALEKCQEGVWYSELEPNHMVRKSSGGDPVREQGPSDTTRALVETLNDFKADLFVTSGHATERDWQIGFRYRNGRFKSKEGRLYGEDTEGKRYEVDSHNPKVYMPIGNCLMGHIDGSEAMALAFMKSAGVHQMLGYTVPTWYGYGGWGVLDYFVEQPGRFSFAEAFFANHQALIHRIETFKPGDKAGGRTFSEHDGRGLRFDRDVVAFYGDPAWVARMAPGEMSWEQSLAEEEGVYTFEIRPLRGETSFDPVNINGSQRGYRPMFAFLEQRIGRAEILEGGELNPVITDNFILVPHPGKCDPQRAYRVRFKAAALR